MGAWGTEPYDNDTAANWLHPVTQPMADEIDELLKKEVSEGLYDEYRVAAWLMSRIGLNHVYDVNRRRGHIAILLDRLRTIAGDNGYIGTWEKPNEFRRSLHNLIDRLELLGC